MRPVDRKSKMVTFRVSPDEYDHLRNACSLKGVRSVSELARTAMESLVHSAGPALPLDLQIQELRERVSALSDKVDRVCEQLHPPRSYPA